MYNILHSVLLLLLVFVIFGALDRFDVRGLQNINEGGWENKRQPELRVILFNQASMMLSSKPFDRKFGPKVLHKGTEQKFKNMKTWLYTIKNCQILVKNLNLPVAKFKFFTKTWFVGKCLKLRYLSEVEVSLWTQTSYFFTTFPPEGGTPIWNRRGCSSSRLGV